MSETIKVTRGSDVQWRIDWQDTDGQPMDMTGWTARAWAQSHIPSGG